VYVEIFWEVEHLAPVQVKSRLALLCVVGWYLLYLVIDGPACQGALTWDGDAGHIIGVGFCQFCVRICSVPPFCGVLQTVMKDVGFLPMARPVLHLTSWRSTLILVSNLLDAG
jgi:hypothetical protein